MSELYNFLDDIMDNSKKPMNIHYAIEYALTYCSTLPTYKGRQQLRRHLYNRQLKREL